MLILDSPYTDPVFNIAAEEYLLKEILDDIAFFYINEPSIIIGKHQNAYAETNFDFVSRNNIRVVRRISGGGTVWHDEGNLNFSFILNGEEGKLVNFREYARPILDFLQDLGVAASFGERNEILVDEYKISGNAEHVFRNRVLHHGTLLFSSDLHALSESLKVNPLKYEDKAVKSIPGKVANIIDFLPLKTDINGFRYSLIEYFQRTYPDSSKYELKDTDKKRISDLAGDKYSSWEWNFGYSPPYRLSRKFELGDLPVYLDLRVEKGMIQKIHILAEGMNPENVEALKKQLTGTAHDPESVRAICKGCGFIKGSQIDIFTDALF